MNLKKIHLSRPAFLLLAAIFLYGIAYNAWSLFLNLSVLASGFDKVFLGLANMMPAIAALVFGIPLGWLSDKIGQRKAMNIGLAAAGTACALMTVSTSAIWIVSACLLWGAGSALFTISQAPYLMAISDEKNRLTLFSLNGSLQIMAGVVGNYLAGLVPSLAAGWLHSTVISPQAFRMVFLFCAIVALAAILPVYLIQPTRRPAVKESIESIEPMDTSPSDLGLRWVLQADMVKLLLPNLIIGAGAGLLIPYLNVFYMEKFHLGSEALGFLFSLSSLITGLGMLVGPRLARRLGGKVQAVVLTQAASLGFMLLSGFSSNLYISSAGFLARAMLINIAPPIWSAFVMEQTAPARQGSMSSFQNLVWTAGWLLGPYLSGWVQNRYGFSPLFIGTFTIYSVAVFMTWVFFGRRESRAEKAPGSITTENVACKAEKD